MAEPAAASRPHVPSRGSSAGRARARESGFAYALLLPTIVAVVLLVLLPLLWNVFISLQQLRLINLRDFGLLSFLGNELTLDNFRLVTGRQGFWSTVARTVVYAFAGTVTSIGLGLWAALAMRRPFPGRGVVRTLMLVPYVVPVVAATFTWRTMLSPQHGMVNAWGQALFGWPRVDYLGQQRLDLSVFGAEVTVPLSFSVVIAFEAWRYFPFAFIFLLARMQAIPRELHEAARVDGATITQQFRYVTYPELRGVIALLFFLRFVWNFNDFTNIYLLTGGGAGTRVVAIEIYEWLIARSNPGAAAALSLVLAAVLLVALTLYLQWFSRREGA